MTNKNYPHQPVLLAEVLQGLAIQPAGIYIDATFGRGGHSQAILQQLNNEGRLIAIDRDPEAAQQAAELAKVDSRFSFHQGKFTQLEEVAKQQEVTGKVCGILLDIGVSSPQLDDPTRGFSFLNDGPLDMRMDNRQGQTAAEWLATAKEAEIADVLYHFGEERFSRRIARAIVNERQVQVIDTTARLADIVSRANPAWERHKHPATRVFQAIRIFINNELDELSVALKQAVDVLKIGGRLTVISFHSLEDRIVKRFYRDQSRPDFGPKELPVPNKFIQPALKLVGKAVLPTEKEIAANPRARSAVLRIAEKLS